MYNYIWLGLGIGLGSVACNYTSFIDITRVTACIS